MTGVGNAAAFGVELPAPSSAWGSAFLLKLEAVGALLVLSVPRTVTLAHLGVSAERARLPTAVSWLYGSTAAGLLLILALAIRLAHG